MRGVGFNITLDAAVYKPFINNFPVMAHISFLSTVVLIFVTQIVNAQSDMDIVNASLGKDYAQFHKTLDSLKVWWVLHLDNDTHKAKRGIVDNKKMYSIADGKGSVKVWAVILDQNTRKVNEMVINYRHDSREQIEDSRKMKDFTALHVGLYSTDIVFMRK